jgi:hypothetical protein
MNVAGQPTQLSVSERGRVLPWRGEFLGFNVGINAGVVDVGSSSQPWRRREKKIGRKLHALLQVIMQRVMLPPF